MISVNDAFDTIINSATPSATEVLALEDANFRILAQPLSARRNQPGANLSAMDGYAIASSSLTNDTATLKVIGSSPAGEPFKGTVKHGETVRIFTGGVVPDGADQVIMQENVTIIDDNTISTNESPNQGKHIRAKGIDFYQGQNLFNMGDMISPKTIGLIAAAGYKHVTVYKAPTVQIITTGEEIVPADQPQFQDHEMVDSASPMIEALCRDTGAVMLPTIHVGDDQSSLKDLLKQAATNADLIITIGGVSVGARDYVKAAMADIGADQNFWKVNMRPGKPLMFSQFNNKHMIGLPGNAISAFVCAILFIRPLIDKLIGRPAPFPQGVLLPINHDLPAHSGRDHYMRARLVGEIGKRQVEAAEQQDSSLVSILAASDGLIVHGASTNDIKAGDLVPFIPF